ncbi:AMP-binding protein [Hydrogenophaga sp.]|uniref:AMP-binding protein n=1 Tax=Hydrogenophaga sp. TaxID=1904254 RepID=UPI00262DA122|nr:AMP-binding protein [Hydrogenophaga sp.]MCW5652122.1 AMP-binding protein [Hydrogenophaga sp.]
METTAYDPNNRGPAMRAAGLWMDETMDDFLARHLQAFPDKQAVVGYRVDRAQPFRLSYRELADRVNRAAAAMHRMGIGRGDVVSVQMPNWWEFAVLALACGRVGAALNPLMPIFRERELGFMLDSAQSKLLVVPKTYRGFDHEAMARDLKAQLPGLRHIAVVDGEGPDGFEQSMQAGPATQGIVVPEGATPLAPDDLAGLMFTSGTTGSPKGVMHSSNTMMACMHALSTRFGIGADDVYLASTPVGHTTGHVAVVLIGLRQGGTVVMQDLWDGRKGVDIMREEKVSYFAGSTPFLNDVCDAVAEGRPAPTALRIFLCGGAPIPPVLVEKARDQVGITVCSLWGMTEVLSGTLTEPQRASQKSASTDGRPLEGMDIRITDDDGREVPAGQAGRLKVRGAQMFLGYHRRPDIVAFDAEGWFDSGDLARQDDEGYIRICGRTKDVLIRGGENVPVVEIESLLLKHPAVQTAAIVGYPDARLGERACAFVTLRPGHALSLQDVQTHMLQCKVAKQYWPERLEVLQAMPATPTGKVQKFRLRELASAFSTPQA